MKLLTFIAGLVSGVGLVLWWGGRRSKALTGQAGEVNDIEDHLTTGDVEVGLLTNELIELWQPNEMIVLDAKQLDDICKWWTELRQSKLDSLADTQPSAIDDSFDALPEEVQEFVNDRLDSIRRDDGPPTVSECYKAMFGEDENFEALKIYEDDTQPIEVK